MKKISNEKLNKIAVFTLVIMILFMSIVSIELIVVVYTEKINTASLKDREITTTTKRIFKDTGVKFRNIDIKNDVISLSSICSKGCNLKTNELSMEYKYIIEKNKNNYLLSIVDGENYILYSKNLGTKVDNLTFRNYLNYVVLSTVVENEHFVFDYAIVLDNQGAIDEFESLDYNEIEYTENGIVYYYDECSKSDGFNAKKVKATRLPFNSSPKIIGLENQNYNWCD